MLFSRSIRIFWLLLLLVSPCCAASQVPTESYEGQPIPESVSIDRIVVYKGDHRMETYRGETLIKVYTVSIGSGGDGDKQYEGDRTTPEGRYRINSRHRSDNFHRFLHISFPDDADVEAFKALEESGGVPEGAGVGSAIGIHGEKEGWEGWPHKWSDWTAGCIAVDNDEIEELYRVVEDEAVIEIRP